MSDDHVMSHTRVLSLKEEHSSEERASAGAKARERKRGRRRELGRERRLFLAAFKPAWKVRGTSEKGRNDAAKEGTEPRRRRPNGARVDAASSLWPDIDPSITDQY